MTMLCIYNYVDKNYDVIIPYTHNTAQVMILPLEIIKIIIHYTIRLTYNQELLSRPKGGRSVRSIAWNGI